MTKKYQRAQGKIKIYDSDLQMTRHQVSQFKIKFKNLMDFIKKKGGIEALNTMPNISSNSILTET